MHKCRQIISFFIFCCLALTGAAQGNEAVFLKRRFSFSAEGESLDRVLDRISELAEINFSYDPTLVDTDVAVNADYADKSLKFILADLLGTEFTFQELGNQIVIRLKESSSDLVPEPEEYKTVSGLILDREFNDPIPYASVSILNKAFGTITNTEGRFELKIPPKYQHERIVVSCLGYQRELLDSTLMPSENLLITLNPINIRLREIKVRAIKPMWVMEQMIKHIPSNYPNESRLMTAFYREVLTQDDAYINVSEAVLQVLKAPYNMPFREDRIRFLKGRKSADVEAFQWVDFKMQGGPYYTNQLDVVKTMDSFLDETYWADYKYEAGNMVDYLGRPTYVIYFSPIGKKDFLTYEGKLFIDQENFALVHAEFSLSKYGIRIARETLIRKKPKGFFVRALSLDYRVSYRKTGELWYLNSAQSSASFRVRSREDKVNSVFHSVSDLLITKHEPTRLRRFPKEEQLSSSDIFTEIISDYDPEFWGSYNIIQPTDDLRKAIRSLGTENKDNQTQ